MSNILLENESIKVELSLLGAEWKKIFAFKDRSPCLWQGDPAIWPRSAPILFPIVGCLKDNNFEFQGRIFSIAKHGFARNCIFRIEYQNSDEIRLRLDHSDETEASYPFRFSFKIQYKLVFESLVSVFTVTNLETDKYIPFAVGAHPAFSYDWLAGGGGDWMNVQVEFEKNEDNFTLLDRHGLIDLNKISPVAVSGRILTLSKDIFNQDALILPQVKSSWVQMVDNASERKIRVTTDRSSSFALWSKSVDRFLCLEPWWGLPNMEGEYVCLAPQQSWSTRWTVSFLG